MKKIMVLVLMSFLFVGLAKAGDKSTRKGFFLDFAPVVGYEYNQFEQWGYGLSLQLGAGVNERVILMGTLQSFVTSVDDVTYSVGQFLFKGQFFPVENSDFYLTAGVGFGRASASADVSGYNVSASSDAGFSAEASAGYQFRTGKKFYLAPEFVVDYSNIESESFITTAAALRLGWYF